ncbi:hypothetical protein BOV89_10650 [Solemya velum gill symbiont]|uniref:antiviral reverse transcriptase Drt5 n=1 Tax=Solemya velum gill symbiont TaxID=2340 RepID=UPI00099791A9|nr:antiviral reverse transcriptase Drt5 [Solemya velum gill symbiont]OOY36780.1 hypothetical protein BOV89_10650 [Solemya velum gill symbiont]
MTDILNFIQSDFSSTLYPLKTNRILAQVHGKEISDYIYQKILNGDHEGDSFLSQHRVYATKPKGHLRRTAKLDPVAEYFIYDICYRNRSIFRPQVSENRCSFGYRFENGSQIPVHVAFNAYKKELKRCSETFKHNIQFDIASYFNSIYHHDICHWFSSKDGVSDIDGQALGQFFREINSGRSVDFLPHGIYPCKMLGNEFLKFIDMSGMLKSKMIIRFMDDFTLFDDDPNVLKHDFIRIQQLFGQFALNVNPSKTYYDNIVGDIQEQLSDIKESLKEIVTDYEEVATASGVEVVETEVEIENPLSVDQVNILVGLLRNEALEESDADLILGFLGIHSDSLLELLPILLERFPNLIKHIYSVCAEVKDKESLTDIILSYLNSDAHFLEYQLFWLAALIEDHLFGVGRYGEVLVKIHEITVDMKIARAKVLEIPEQGFGFKELRDECLKTGQSDWLSWSSAIGTQSLKPAERNYMLNYFSSSSPMNYLIASGVRKL